MKDETYNNKLFAKAGEVASILDMKRSTFYEKRPLLEKEGFPPKDKLVNGWPMPEIIDWYTRRYGKKLNADGADGFDCDPFLKAVETFNA